MQNRYVGDIGDFGKYGLLRSLSGLTETPTLTACCAWVSSGTSTRMSLITPTADSLATFVTLQTIAPSSASATLHSTRHSARWLPETAAMSPQSATAESCPAIRRSISASSPTSLEHRGLQDRQREKTGSGARWKPLLVQMWSSSTPTMASPKESKTAGARRAASMYSSRSFVPFGIGIKASSSTITLDATARRFSRSSTLPESCGRSSAYPAVRGHCGSAEVQHGPISLRRNRDTSLFLRAG